MLVLFTVAALLGYLIGSIPFAVFIAHAHGIDIFKVGSGNPGATNVKRSVGKQAGNLCFFLDLGKGVVAAGWPIVFLSGHEYVTELGIVGLFFAIFGHSFSVFIRFRGGKGVATTVGGLVTVMPMVTIIGILVWIATFYATRYVSLASILLGVSLPISAFFLPGRIVSEVAFALFLAVILVVRHRSNIKRLLNGTENRFSRSSGRSV